MSKDMPWLDIFPTEVWDQYIVQHKQNTLKTGALRVGAKPPSTKKSLLDIFKLGKRSDENELLLTLRNYVDVYHSVPKADIGTLTMRANLLDTIAQRAEGYLAKFDTSREKMEKNTVVYLLFKLIRRARRKAAYIRKLKEHCDSKDKGFTSAKKLIEYLVKDRGRDDGLVALQPGVLLERMDPWHRAFEVGLARDKDGQAGFAGEKDSYLSIAIFRWVKEPNPEDVPFFVWLEKDYVCTGQHDKVSRFYGEKVTINPKGGVTYLHQGESVPLLVMFLNSCAYSTVLDANNHNTLMSTCPVTSKVPGAYAYVWTKDSMLLCAPHVGGTFHHSSFTSGKKVRCAGMITFKDGKVTRVDSNSGHYMPGTNNLKNFVRFIQDEGGFVAEAAVKDEKTKTLYNSVMLFLKS